MAGLIEDLSLLLLRSRPSPGEFREAKSSLGAERAAIAAESLLRWLARRATDQPLHPLHAEKERLAPEESVARTLDLATLIASSDQLGALFAWSGDELDFRPEVSLKRRRRLEGEALAAFDALDAAASSS